MNRKVYKDLLDWKHSKTRKPLLLLGARQVGKTWLMREFGRNEYENTAYINCDNEPLVQNLFNADYDINRLILAFQAITNQKINPHSTLIILDELQQAPRGLHCLKYFCENSPEYHVMAAGSLLGVTLAQNESFPVGKVDMIHLYPMDFEEFLSGIGHNELCSILAKNDELLTATFAPKITEYLFQYYYVGGMPEVVASYADDYDFKRVRELQSTIIEAYRRDISKHTSKTESIRIGQVLDSLPSQLAKENKRFIYGAARPGARAADFEIAIQWLIDAGLVYKSQRVSKIGFPLKFYEDISAFKLFFIDVGLLGYMSDIPATIIISDSAVMTEFRGMLTEQYVAQQLKVANQNLYYWTNDRTPAEIDFVIQHNNDIIPIEVKASTNVRGKSLNRYLQDNPNNRAIRFSLLGYKKQDQITNIPLYEIPFRMIK